MKSEDVNNFEDEDKVIREKQVKMEPQFDFTIENSTLQVDYVNVDQV